MKAARHFPQKPRMDGKTARMSKDNREWVRKTAKMSKNNREWM
jgi:hypothetical protein